MPNPTASDCRARWGISAVFFADGAALGGYVAHLPDIQAKLHLTNAELGRTMLFSALGAITTMPLAGPLIHRIGSRALTMAGLLALLLIAPFFVLASSVPLVCLALYCIGVSNGQADVAMNTHSMSVQDRFPKPILSAIHGWFSLGGFVGGAGAALTAKLGGSPATHMILSSLLLLIPAVYGLTGLLPWDTDKNAEAPKLALPNRRTLFLGLLVVSAFVSEGALWDWSAVFLRKVLHSGAALGAFGFALASAGMALGRLLGDEWIHRLGYRQVLAGSAVLSGVAMLVATHVPNVYVSIAAFTLMGVGVANMVPLLFRAAARQPGISASAGLAAVTTCGYTGFLGGPPLLGYVADRFTLPFALSLLAGLCFVIAFGSRKAMTHLQSGS